MTDLLNHLSIGFSVALNLTNLLYCLIGTLLGTLIGVLPGIGPTATIAMLLPITFKLPAISALIMLAGIYYGAQYGGSTTAILVNLPGEASAVVTCLDGYAMARKGRPGVALATAALGSFFAGCFATLLIVLFAPVLAGVAIKFGPAEYFSMMLLGLTAAVILAHGSVLKAMAMVVLGLLLGMVGTDVTSGLTRFNLGLPQLADGIDFVVVAMGLFGYAEIISSLRRQDSRAVVQTHLTGLWPTREDFRMAWKAVIRGTLLGSALGVLPGGTATLSSFAAYTLEKKIAADPSRFGQGAIEGLAGPESANNAAAQTSFIPMLTLGIPPNSVMALMIGAMMIQGIAPGPQVMTARPELFWGMLASMWVGNLMLVILNLPLIGLWVRLLKVPYRLLFPSILSFCCIGVYSLSSNTLDVVLTALFGLLGYVLINLECEPAPLLLGFILGPMMEENFRRAMLMSRGDATVFFTEPISLAMLLMTAALFILIVAPAVRRKREEAFQEGG